MKLELDENSKIETDTNSLGLNDSNIYSSNNFSTGEGYDNIDLRIEKDELVTKSDFPINKGSISNNKINLRRYGNTYVCFFNKNGDPQIVIGPHCNLIVFSFKK